MDIIVVAGKTVAFVGSGEVLIDSDVFSKLTPENQSEAFNMVNDTKIASRFISGQELSSMAKIPNIITNLKNKNTDFKRGLAFVGIDVPAALSVHLANISTNEDNYATEKAELEAAYKARKEALDKLYNDETMPLIIQLQQMLPPYSYVESGSNYCRFGAKRISRNGYELMATTAKKVWDEIAPIWADADKWKYSGNNYYLNSPENRRISNTHTCRVHQNYMKIGCQEISRYEFEQAQLHYGWALPNMIKEEAS